MKYEYYTWGKVEDYNDVLILGRDAEVYRVDVAGNTYEYWDKKSAWHKGWCKNWTEKQNDARTANKELVKISRKDLPEVIRKTTPEEEVEKPVEDFVYVCSSHYPFVRRVKVLARFNDQVVFAESPNSKNVEVIHKNLVHSNLDDVIADSWK